MKENQYGVDPTRQFGIYVTCSGNTFGIIILLYLCGQALNATATQ